MTPSLPKLASVRLKAYSAKGDGTQADQGRPRCVAAICAHEDVYEPREAKRKPEQDTVCSELDNQTARNKSEKRRHKTQRSTSVITRKKVVWVEGQFDDSKVFD